MLNGGDRELNEVLSSDAKPNVCGRGMGICRVMGRPRVAAHAFRLTGGWRGRDEIPCLKPCCCWRVSNPSRLVKWRADFSSVIKKAKTPTKIQLPMNRHFAPSLLPSEPPPVDCMLVCYCSVRVLFSRALCVVCLCIADWPRAPTFGTGPSLFPPFSWTKQ